MSDEREQATELGKGPSAPSSPLPVDTERTAPLDRETPPPAAEQSNERLRPQTTQVMGSFSPETLATAGHSSLDIPIEYSAIQHKSDETGKVSPHRPAPARELAAPKNAAEKNAQKPDEEGSHTTMQSMIRPDLMAHGIADPRRFLSIERELSELSAAIKFLEKRLHRGEKDSRIALALAGLAVLLAVLGYLL
jgi:hypothetical protein